MKPGYSTTQIDGLRATRRPGPDEPTIGEVVHDRPQTRIRADTIRQLEWTTPTCGPDEYLTVADAAPCEFRYEIDNGGNTAKPYRIKRACNIQAFAWASSIEAAKACAQRDFQERIISAFV